VLHNTYDFIQTGDISFCLPSFVTYCRKRLQTLTILSDVVVHGKIWVRDFARAQLCL